jgi:hypothetical protein
VRVRTTARGGTQALSVVSQSAGNTHAGQRGTYRQGSAKALARSHLAARYKLGGGSGRHKRLARDELLGRGREARRGRRRRCGRGGWRGLRLRLRLRCRSRRLCLPLCGSCVRRSVHARKRVSTVRIKARASHRASRKPASLVIGARRTIVQIRRIRVVGVARRRLGSAPGCGCGAGVGATKLSTIGATAVCCGGAPPPPLPPLPLPPLPPRPPRPTVCCGGAPPPPPPTGSSPIFASGVKWDLGVRMSRSLSVATHRHHPWARPAQTQPASPGASPTQAPVAM